MCRLASQSPNLLEYLCIEFHSILIILCCKEKETKILSSILVQNFKQASPASYTLEGYNGLAQSYIFNINLSQFKDHHNFFS